MSGRGVRRMAPPFVVAPPVGARVRTRLRVSEADAGVLRTVGEHLGSSAGADLAWRCSIGRAAGSGARRGERKRALTACSSSRWAGAITRTSNDQWNRGYENLVDERAGLRRTIAVIERRLAAPVGGRAGRVRGYATRSERWAKQQRRQRLVARLAAVDRRIVTGRVSVARGGRRLAKVRHHLDEAGLTVQLWRERWQAKRMFVCADGEADKTWGNETIRVHPEQGWCEIKLPTPLAGLANTTHGRYRLSGPVTFSYRADEWAAQAAGGAVRYDIGYDPVRDRWYLDASWTVDPVGPPSLDQLRSQPILGVDLNADHLACWVIDADGNPVGGPLTIGLDLGLAGQPASTRAGRLRQAISRLLAIAAEYGCAAVAIEDLGFTEARQTGRETMGRGRRGKRFRRTVAGIPTAQFRTRLAAMAHHRRLAVVAVDPAHTSQWGSQHWHTPLNDQTSPSTTVSRHHAAAVVIGRRSHGHRARRRPGVPRSPHQRMGPGKLPARPDPTNEVARNPAPHQATRQTTRGRKTCLADRDPPGNQATQNRSGPPRSTLPGVTS